MEAEHKFFFSLIVQPIHLLMALQLVEELVLPLLYGSIKQEYFSYLSSGIMLKTQALFTIFYVTWFNLPIAHQIQIGLMKNLKIRIRIRYSTLTEL